MLAAGPAHGYGIARDVEGESEGHITLSAGTLYGALDRLMTAGLIEIDNEAVVDSRLRRYYRLTNEGARRLEEEAERAGAQAGRALERLRILAPLLVAPTPARSLSPRGA